MNVDWIMIGFNSARLIYRRSKFDHKNCIYRMFELFSFLSLFTISSTFSSLRKVF